MALDRPVFVLDVPNPSTYITDAEWWLWLRLHELEPTSQLAGIYANKSGFHNTGQANLDNWPNNYSIRDEPNHTGPYWKTKASAIDWMFPEAQNGDYGRIDKYSSRLIASGEDPNDPRLDLVMYAFFGQADWDSQVEGYNEYREEHVSSDPSHLWHMHIEFFRNKCHDFWAMWALLTVLMGWSVAQWQASLTGEGDDMFCKKNDTGDKPLDLQIKLVDMGYWVGPDDATDRSQPYNYCDGQYGGWTARALAQALGNPNNNGESFGPWEHRALDLKYTKQFGGGGAQGDPGEPGKDGKDGVDGKTPTKVKVLLEADVVEVV